LFRLAFVDTCFEYANPILLDKRVGKPRPAGFPDLARGIVDLKYHGAPGSHAVPILAVRACRRALLDDPNDAMAWFRLQLAYALLRQEHKERVGGARLALLQSVRQVQRMAALNHAILLDPDNDAAHLQLASLYEQMSGQGEGGYRDLQLKHLSEYLRLMQEA